MSKIIRAIFYLHFCLLFGVSIDTALAGPIWEEIQRRSDENVAEEVAALIKDPKRSAVNSHEVIDCSLVECPEVTCTEGYCPSPVVMIPPPLDARKPSDQNPDAYSDEYSEDDVEQRPTERVRRRNSINRSSSSYSSRDERSSRSRNQRDKKRGRADDVEDFEGALDELNDIRQVSKRQRSTKRSGFPVESRYKDDYSYTRAAQDKYNRMIEKIERNVRAEGFDTVFGHDDKPSIIDGHYLDVSFFESSIREAFAEVSSQTKIPFILEDDVQGFVTLKMNKVTLDRALNMLLAAGNYQYKDMGDYILVGTANSSNPRFDDLKKTKVMRPAYMMPSEIMKLLDERYQKMIRINDDANTLVITAGKTYMERIVRDIKRIEKRPPQVLLEVLVADISLTAKHELGIDWWSTNGSLMSPIDRSLDVSQMFGFATADGEFTLSSPYEILNLRINALSDIGEAQVWATPKVMTVDGKKADISVKSIQTFPLVSGPEKYLQVETKNYESGVELSITPKISDDGDINLHIGNATVTTIAMTGEQQSTGERMPVQTTRKISTTVSVKNNKTLVIGGLLDIQGAEENKRIPGGEAKGLKELAGTGKVKRNTRDLLIFITPHVLWGRPLDFSEDNR